MARALLVALVALSTASAAQKAPAQPEKKPEQPPAAGDAASVDDKIEAAKKEMREEMRAQLATQSAAQGWEEEWVEQTRKLELLELDGYLRVRPDLLHKLDLRRLPDPSGHRLFPVPYTSDQETTLAGVNMRFRLDPTINVSEEVRIKAQVDVLDNLVFGTSPAYATASERYLFGVESRGQVSPSAVDLLRDSITVKRAYGEVSTPVGILRFGRMGSHWGLGMVHNDGNCVDCDFGDTVDRIQFVTEPFTGWYFAPMIDFDVEGPLKNTKEDAQGQPVDYSNSDDAHSLILAIARRDTPQQERAKLDNGLSVLNYGIHFSYRTQRWDPVGLSDPNVPDDPDDLGSIGLDAYRQFRSAQLFVPDLWAKFERKAFRIEAEVAAVYGTLEAQVPLVGGRTSQSLTLLQFGGVVQSELRFMDGQLRIGLEAGFASGDKEPGFGNFPGRDTDDPDGNTTEHEIDGRQFVCSSTAPTCADTFIRNFRFNREYRPDLILYRELLGGVTDSLYLKPTITYSVAPGFDIFGSVIGSGAIYAESTPSGKGNLLGLELNVGAHYETEDGFLARIQWGILLPQEGLSNPDEGPDVETAQAVRAILGVKF